jgi:hypothetical protein
VTRYRQRSWTPPPPPIRVTAVRRSCSTTARRTGTTSPREAAQHRPPAALSSPLPGPYRRDRRQRANRHDLQCPSLASVLARTHPCRRNRTGACRPRPRTMIAATVGWRYWRCNWARQFRRSCRTARGIPSSIRHGMAEHVEPASLRSKIGLGREWGSGLGVAAGGSGGGRGR